MNSFTDLQTRLAADPKTWLVTGVAGFIGSNLLETLLQLNQHVVGLDNFSTGHQCNPDEVKTLVNLKQWENFQFIEGDVRHSLADISKAQTLLGYSPAFDIVAGISKAMPWYIGKAASL